MPMTPGQVTASVSSPVLNRCQAGAKQASHGRPILLYQRDQVCGNRFKVALWVAVIVRQPAAQWEQVQAEERVCFESRIDIDTGRQSDYAGNL